MTMQYDVKSYHNTVSGVAVPYRTRLKGVVVSPSTSVTHNACVLNKIPSPGIKFANGLFVLLGMLN